MHVKVWQQDWTGMPLRGVVNYHLEGVGFGMLFANLDPEAAAAIRRLVEAGGAAGQAEAEGEAGGADAD